MFLLILGLVLFLGAHSVRIFAEDWRTGIISRLGAQRWKGVYSLVSILGFLLIIWGFAQARHGAPQLWAPPVWARHLNLLVMLVSLILFAAANPKPSHYKAILHHPMVWGVILWSGGHLLANGTQADAVLFGAFFVWGALDLFAAYARDRRERVVYAAPQWRSTIIATIAGAAVWAVFVFWAHLWLFGVSPLARG
jgi:uncharacterized membrane protein